MSLQVTTNEGDDELALVTIRGPNQVTLPFAALIVGDRRRSPLVSAMSLSELPAADQVSAAQLCVSVHSTRVDCGITK